MTPRPLAPTRRAALAAAAAGLLGLAGCDPRAIFYFLQPNDPSIAAPGPSLKGKKVVVLTRAAQGTQGDFVALDKELSRELARILRKEVKKVEVVDVDKVFAWTQAHPDWSDPAEAAEAFEADAVVHLEVEQFQISSPSSPNLFEGRSKIHVMLLSMDHPKDSKGHALKDKPRESDRVYDEYQDTAFPVRGPMPEEAGISRSAFRNKFLKLVATEVSWHFVDHAPGDNIQDTRFSE